MVFREMYVDGLVLYSVLSTSLPKSISPSTHFLYGIIVFGLYSRVLCFNTCMKQIFVFVCEKVRRDRMRPFWIKTPKTENMNDGKGKKNEKKHCFMYVASIIGLSCRCCCCCCCCLEHYTLSSYNVSVRFWKDNQNGFWCDVIWNMHTRTWNSTSD